MTKSEIAEASDVHNTSRLKRIMSVITAVGVVIRRGATGRRRKLHLRFLMTRLAKESADAHTLDSTNLR